MPSRRAWTVGAPAGTDAKAASPRERAGPTSHAGPPPARAPERRRRPRDRPSSRDSSSAAGLGRLEAEAGIRGIVERLGEWRLPVPCRLLGPPLPPRLGGRNRHLAVRSCKPHERPRPGHDPVRVVAPATRRQPAAACPAVRDRVDDPCRGPHRRGGDPEVRQRIERVRVGAVLRHHDVGPEGRRERRHQQPDRIQPRPLTRPRLERHVDRGPGRGALPDLVGEARPGKEVATGLVDGHRQDARVVPEQRLDAVAVMHVEVDVQDPQSVAAGAGHRQRHVVVDAEAGCTVAHRVVQPAARVEGVLDVAAQDRLHRPQRSARHHRTGLVHVPERGHVAAFGDPRGGQPEGIRGEAPNDADEPRGVAGQELLVHDRLRRQSGRRTDRPQQVDPRSEPARRQGVAGPEVVRRRARPVHEEHRGTIAGLGRAREALPSRHAGRPDHRPHPDPRRRPHLARSQDAAEMGRGGGSGGPWGPDGGHEGPERDPEAAGRHRTRPTTTRRPPA